MKLGDLHNLYLSGEYKLKKEFNDHTYRNESLIERAEQYAGWTLPVTFPIDELSNNEELQNDYQSVGAHAVTNLANKIMIALFQPSRPFFKMTLNDKQKQELEEEAALDQAEIEKVLAYSEREAMRELERVRARVTLTNIITQLIITGNSLMYLGKDSIQEYTLRDYVVKRDLEGEVVKIIFRDAKQVMGLTEEQQLLAKEHNYKESDTVTLFTCVQRVGKRYIVWQELEDLCYCHERIGQYSLKDCPWVPLTWNLARKQDYGTGLVENHAGDFHSLSTVSEAILDYVTLLTDVKTLVNPAGQTDVKVITEAPSGSYVPGVEEDLFVHTPNIAGNTIFLREEFAAIEKRIGVAFLVNSAVTRDAERVTAEEIRMQANELESSLGGVYSRLATELQVPLARYLLKSVDKTFKDVEPTIVTGLESLSRNSELDRLRSFFIDLNALAEVPEEVAIRIDYEKLISVLGARHGVDYDAILKPKEQVEEDLRKRMALNAEAEGMREQAVTQGKGE